MTFIIRNRKREVDCERDAERQRDAERDRERQRGGMQIIGQRSARAERDRD